jgi:hypothetical protein
VPKNPTTKRSAHTETRRIAEAADFQSIIRNS